MCFSPAVIGHWKLVIGHSIQISHDPSCVGNNLFIGPPNSQKHAA